MSVSYQAALRQARTFLREEGNRLTPPDWLLIAEQSRQHFSRDKPCQRIADIAATGAATFTLTGVVDGWITKSSRVEQIENPTGEQIPAMWKTDSFMLYRPSDSVEQLRFLDAVPANGTTIRMTYSVPHTFSEAASTINDQDLMLIGLLIASYAAQALQADFLKPNRSNLPNDSVDYSQKARDMGELSDRLLKQYSKMVAGTTEGAKQHFTFVRDYDMMTSVGTEYPIHGKDGR
jgi:hypothetical protein